jgi:hypothetical protein
MKQYTLKIYFGDKSEPAFLVATGRMIHRIRHRSRWLLKSRETVIHMPLAYVRVKNCHSL